MKGHFYDIVPFYSDVPRAGEELPGAPAGDEKSCSSRCTTARPGTTPTCRATRAEYFWEVKDILPFKGEADMVDPSDVAPKLLISTSPDWQAKSLWFYKVNEDYGSFEFDDEIKAKVDEIVRGAKDDWEKISRLTHWVAEEIRYSGISMGPGEGYTLHKGTMTFRDRCGVCKDKAGMLITMLRAAGFESYPAMTMAGSRIDRIPADQFNHSVTLVKVDGKYHLLDPTWVPGVRELWSSAEQQQEYLMGVPEGADLASTPLSPAENHYVRYRLDSAVDDDGTLQGPRARDGRGAVRFQPAPHLHPLPAPPAGPTSCRRSSSACTRRRAFPTSSSPIPIDIAKPMLIAFQVEIPGYLKKGERDRHAPARCRPRCPSRASWASCRLEHRARARGNTPSACAVRSRWRCAKP